MLFVSHTHPPTMFEFFFGAICRAWAYTRGEFALLGAWPKWILVLP